MSENIITWLCEGEKGMSSEVMAVTALGRPNKHYNNFAPSDPADLNRCIKLVKAAPEVKNAFPKIAKLSAEWKAVIDNWDSLVESFISEVGYDWSNSKTAPKTYDLMHQLGLN